MPTNKAIRDGKYLALPHSSAWQRSPFLFRDVISLLAIFFINSHTKYLKEIVCHNFFEIYAIELLGSLPSDEAWRHLRYITFVYGVHWFTGSTCISTVHKIYKNTEKWAILDTFIFQLDKSIAPDHTMTYRFHTLGQWRTPGTPSSPGLSRATSPPRLW